jgi:tetratricopeptide (TPR) repeat protein
MFISKFVGRTSELDQLDTAFVKVLGGQSVARLIQGPSGIGKTSLATTFIQRINKACPDLLVARSECNPQVGMCDPYLPFRNLIEQLVTHGEELGPFSSVARDRMMRILLESGKLLLEKAPDLIGSVIPMSGTFMTLGKRMLGSEEWYRKLQGRFDGNQVEFSLEQIAPQCTELLKAMARKRPILLFIDDIQWLDAASSSLVVYLMSQLTNERLMILATYREDNSTLREGLTPPMAGAITELTEQDGQLMISLGNETLDEKRRLVDMLIDRETNHLDEAFRTQLLDHTNGNPLFVREVIKSLREQEYLQQDAHGAWVASNELRWHVVPDRIQGVLETRLNRVDEFTKEILAIASVEGMACRSKVLSQVSGLPERKVVRMLTRELERKHQTMYEGKAICIDNQWFSFFHFNNALVQQFVYEDLGKRERMLLHEDVGRALEKLFAGQEDSVAAELARHFFESGHYLKSYDYYLVAIRQALQLGAYQEANLLCENARNLLDHIDEHVASKKELEILVLHSTAVKALTGWTSAKVKAIFSRIREVCQRGGDSPDLAAALFGLWACHLGDLEIADSINIATECLSLGERLDDPDILIQAHIAIGNASFWQGNMEQTIKHMALAEALVDEDRRQQQLLRYGQDPLSLIYMFQMLAMTANGLNPQVGRLIEKALCHARSTNHRFSLAVCLQGIAWTYLQLKEGDKAQQYADELIILSQEDGYTFYDAVGQMFKGAAEILLGQFSRGVARLEKGYRTQEVSLNCKVFLSLFEYFHICAQRGSGESLLSDALKMAYLTRQLQQGDMVYHQRLTAC